MPSSTGHQARLALVVLLLALAMTPVDAAVARTPKPSPAPHRTSAGWTAGPATGGAGEGVGRPSFYLEGPPGAVLQDRLSVTNPGTEPVTVGLRATDAPDPEENGPAVRTGRAAAGTGAWLRTAVPELTVPPRTRAEVPFSVTVPVGTPPGDRSAAIVVRGGDHAVDVRVRLRVGGPTLAALTVEDVTVSGRTIHYALVNRGNTVLAPRLAVEADGVFGTLLQRGSRALPVELGPGQRVRLTEPWREVPALDAATVRLRVTAAGGAHGEATARAVFVPWVPVTGGALLLLATAVAGASGYRRRRARGRPARGSGPSAHVDGAAPGRAPGDRQGSDTRHLVKAGGES
ncbi:hypothetical protein [Streptomyces sp. NPDC056061]|uniref:COG1470 family protein n=1 Tax=Streptomyces sp. NPDC056061 TaxID=3345700 RepID=UPI0035DA4DDC